MSFTIEPIKGVKQVQNPDYKQKKIDYKGSDMIPIEYPNIFFYGRKHTGKTVCLNHVLDSRIKKGDFIFGITPTLNQDPVWMDMKRKFEKNNLVMLFPSIYSVPDPDFPGEHVAAKKSLANNVVHLLRSFLKKEAKTKGQDPLLKENYKKRRSFLILDDSSLETSDEILEVLLKENRHNRLTVLISSQYDTDLPSRARQQIDIFCLFEGHPKRKLKDIFNVIGSRLDFEDFKRLYEFCTKERYNFMCVNKPDQKMRKNFNKSIKLISDNIEEEDV